MIVQSPARNQKLFLAGTLLLGREQIFVEPACRALN